MTEGVRGRQERGEQTGNLTVLASRWAHAVAGTSYVPLRPDEVEELLLAFVRRLVAAASESVTAARTVGVEVGAALVDAHFTNPRTLSQTVAVLLDGQPDAGDRGTGRPPGHGDGKADATSIRSRRGGERLWPGSPRGSVQRCRSARCGSRRRSLKPPLRRGIRHSRRCRSARSAFVRCSKGPRSGSASVT